jgi:hypothetical protein
MTITWPAFGKRLRWLDGSPLSVERYRARIFARALDTFDADGRPQFNLIVTGRAKKNWKTADLVLAALFCLIGESPAGHDAECYVLANDGDQARDDLALAKKLVKVNPVLQEWLQVKRDSIERRDGGGFLNVLPAGDVAGTHGKSYRFAGYDEIHGYRTWDIFEAMQPDPHRRDAQQWITSYASLFHRPGVPLFDLLTIGKAGADSRMLFSWYAADYTTDPDFMNASPEQRANPSMASWTDGGYLAQQQRRLPAHKYRRLHLNLPGLPEGSAFQPEPVMDAVARGVVIRPPVAGVSYAGFVDMSGGSVDDAVLAIGHQDADERIVVDAVVDQGERPPFDPNKAVERFVRTLRDYRIARVVGDRYAGETFRRQFEAQGIAYVTANSTKSELYEALEPRLNGKQLVLLDVPPLEQQFLGLVWRGGRIDHAPGEHDDYANAAAGVVDVLATAGAGVGAASLHWAGVAIDGQDDLDDEPEKGGSYWGATNASGRLYARRPSQRQPPPDGESFY